MTNSNDAQPPVSTKEAKTNSKQAIKAVKCRSISLTLLALIATGVSSYALYIQQQMHQQIQMMSLDTQSLKQQLFNDKNQINQLQTTLHTANDNLTVKLNRLDKTLQSALQQRWYQSNDWLMLKARYYLELAEINANWSSDTHTTIALILQADTLLASIHDQRLFAIRQSIANEITQLKSISIVDTAGILSQIDAAQHLIATLPIKNAATMNNKANKLDSNTTTTASTWRERLKQSIGQLEKLVIIQHHDEAIQPLLTPAYEAILRETIRLNLQAAQWAVLQNNQAVYQLSLTQAIENIKRVFNPDETSTQALTNQLKQLEQLQIIQQKIIPDQSLPQLNQLIDTKNKPSGDLKPPIVGAPS